MAKTKEKKQSEVKSLVDKFSKMKIGVFTSYNGLKVKDLNHLRQELRKEGIDYQAAKKSLLKLALKEKALVDINLDTLDGSLGLAFGYTDEVTTPKILDKFKKDHEQLQILGGIYNNQFIAKEKIMALAKILGKQELLTQLVWVIKSPVSNFGYLLKANLQGFVNVLNQIKEKVTT